MRRHGATIWGEVELAWHFGKGKVAAVTGTNGKTTTTTLVGEIFKSWFPKVFVVGNIGTAYTHEAHYIVLTVLSRGQAVVLRRRLKQEDPRAFMIVANSSEIFGKGFLQP